MSRHMVRVGAIKSVDGLNTAGAQDDIQGEAYNSALFSVFLVYTFVWRELPRIRREHPEWFTNAGNGAGDQESPQ